MTRTENANALEPGSDRDVYIHYARARNENHNDVADHLVRIAMYLNIMQEHAMTMMTNTTWLMCKNMMEIMMCTTIVREQAMNDEMTSITLLILRI